MFRASTRDRMPKPYAKLFDGLSVSAALPLLVERGDDRGTFALSAAYRRDRECLRAFAPKAKTAITASPIVINLAQGPSTPALWRLTRAPSSSNDRVSAS